MIIGTTHKRMTQINIYYDYNILYTAIIVQYYIL